MPDDALSITVSARQLALLKKLAFPCSGPVLASARALDDDTWELTGSTRQLESLAGWVASEANHTRRGRRQDELADLSEQLETALLIAR